MNKAEKTALVSVPIAIGIGTLVAIAGSQFGDMFNGFPVFVLVIGIAFIIQVVAFVPAYKSQTEKYYDITGTITYVLTTAIALLLTEILDIRSLLLAALIVIWALRLGIFLFIRVHNVGKDGRFDNLKPSFIRYLNTWVIQGLWVSFTSAAALAAISSKTKVDLGIVGVVGLIIWAAGFAIEIIADSQKKKFKANPKNINKFIDEGLWARSRHPNYFGEILLWFGVSVIAFPVLQGAQLFTLISPIFVYILLTKGSGIPILEKRADKKWGGMPEYEEYKKSTPILVPKVFQ
jgi:steroid 5-alpha reductase family enzyme